MSLPRQTQDCNVNTWPDSFATHTRSRLCTTKTRLVKPAVPFWRQTTFQHRCVIRWIRYLHHAATISMRPSKKLTRNWFLLPAVCAVTKSGKLQPRPNPAKRSFGPAGSGLSQKAERQVVSTKCQNGVLNSAPVLKNRYCEHRSTDLP